MSPINRLEMSFQAEAAVSQPEAAYVQVKIFSNLSGTALRTKYSSVVLTSIHFSPDCLNGLSLEVTAGMLFFQ